MTATDELRRLLDERGVECRQSEWIDGTTIKWHGSDGSEYGARNGLSFDGPTGRLVLYDLTPEQAIEATLGRGECRSTTSDDAWCFACSECGKSFPKHELHLAHNHGEINYCPNCGRRCVG